MATQRLSLDPQLWNRTRRAAFDRGISASKLVETAIEEYLEREGKPRARVAKGVTLLDNHDASIPVARVDDIETTNRGVTIHATKLDLRTIPQSKTVFEDAPPPPVVVTAAPWDVSPKATMGAVITTPEEAAARVAEVAKARPFSPVPKPVRKPRAKR
jgi:hypothetical protein